MRYVGLVIHWRQSTICVLDHRGRKLSSQTIRSGWWKVLEEVRKLRKPFSICFEASSGYGFLFEQLSAVARRVVVQIDLSKTASARDPELRAGRVEL